jgi:hypothetical protein
MRKQRYWGLFFLLIIGVLAGYFLSQNIRTTAGNTAKVYTGYLVCQMCAAQGMAADGADVQKHPEKHTVNCLKMYTCVKSGFGIFIQSKDGNYTFYKFDKKGNDLAYENIVAKTAKSDNLLVRITGKLNGNSISVNAISEQ